MNISIVNVALPTIRDHFDMSSVQLQWIITAYVLTFAGFLLFGGRSSDLFGRKKVFLWGIAIFTVGSLMNGISFNSLLLIAGRAIQGIGAAITIPAAMSMISTSFQEGFERNRALSLFGSMGAIGFACGLIAGGVLTDLMGWRYIFLTNIPFALIIFIGILNIAKENSIFIKERSIDYVGTSVGTVGLIVLVLGVTRGEAIGWNSPSPFILLVAGLLLLIGFIFIESKVKQPIMPLRLFKSKSLVISSIGMFLQNSVFIGSVFFGTLYLQGVLNYSVMQTGFAFLPMSVGAVFAAKFTPKVIEIVKMKKVYIFAMLLLAGSLFWMSTLAINSSYIMFTLPIFFLVGVAVNIGFTSALIGALAEVDESDHGVAGGIVNTFFQVGSGVGLSILVTISNITIGHDTVPSKNLMIEGYSNALFAGGFFALLAALVIFIFMNKKI